MKSEPFGPSYFLEYRAGKKMPLFVRPTYTRPTPLPQTSPPFLEKIKNFHYKSPEISTCMKTIFHTSVYLIDNFFEEEWRRGRGVGRSDKSRSITCIPEYNRWKENIDEVENKKWRPEKQFQLWGVRNVASHVLTISFFCTSSLLWPLSLVAVLWRCLATL